MKYMFNRNSLSRTIILFIFFCKIFISYDKIAYTQQPPHLWRFENTPIWSDEFSDNGLPDTSKWSYETGHDGWGNNELQHYTHGGNSVIEDGVLKIIAKKEFKDGREYTSSRMITKNKGDWLYCRVEVKAKMQEGRGTWSAIWMLPSDGSYSQLTGGEIDILEYVGFDPNQAHFSVHTPANNSDLKNERTAKIFVPDAMNNFHLYTVDWTPYGIRGYVDGIKYFEYRNEGGGYQYWPFDKRFFLILNLAIGGSWGGQNGIDNKIFPATMEVDYVRVYNFLQ